MKTNILLYLFVFAAVPAMAQMITSSTPAKLQVYAMKPDGVQSVMTSDQLIIVYDQLKMMGEIELYSFQTDDMLLRNMLDSALAERINISGVIPEGKFAFHDALEERFVVETEIQFGEIQSRIILNFTVSNRNTSLANSFDITCTGSLSLRNDLGITRDTGLDDKISFQFFQFVQAKNY